MGTIDPRVRLSDEIRERVIALVLSGERGARGSVFDDGVSEAVEVLRLALEHLDGTTKSPNLVRTMLDAVRPTEVRRFVTIVDRSVRQLIALRNAKKDVGNLDNRADALLRHLVNQFPARGPDGSPKLASVKRRDLATWLANPKLTSTGIAARIIASAGGLFGYGTDVPSVTNRVSRVWLGTK